MKHFVHFAASLGFEVLFGVLCLHQNSTISMPCVGVISLCFKFISGLTNVLLKSFIWKKVNI